MIDFSKMSDTDVIAVHVRPKHPRFNSDILPLPERIDHEMDVQRVNRRELHRLLHDMEVFDKDGDLITFDAMNGRFAQNQAPVKPNPPVDEDPENPGEGGEENPGGEDPKDPEEGGNEPENPGEGGEENPDGPGTDPENPGEGGEENPDNPGEGEVNPGEGDNDNPNPNPPSGGGGGLNWEDFGDLLG